VALGLSQSLSTLIDMILWFAQLVTTVMILR